MDERTVDEVLRALAEGQHAVVARYQLRKVGITRDARRRRARSTDWEAVTDRVLRLVGSPGTDQQRAMAAVLDAGPGAVLSHASAAALWNLPGFRLDRLEVSRERRRSSRPAALAVVHHPLVLPAHHCTVRDGIPVTTLGRTVLDLASTEHSARFELAAHAAVRLGLTWEHLGSVHAELPPVRPGTGVIRALLAANLGRPPLGSGLEGRVLRLLAAAGLPEPRRQVDLGAGDWIGRVDFYFPAARLVLEVDGEWWHDGALDTQRDRRRTAALEAAGFRVLRLPERLIRRSPDEVPGLVRAALTGAA